jgi:hypothetical protein
MLTGFDRMHPGRELYALAMSSRPLHPAGDVVPLIYDTVPDSKYKIVNDEQIRKSG